MAEPLALLRSKHSSFLLKDSFSRILTFLRPLFHLKTPFEGVDASSCANGVPGRSESFPWEFDQSLSIDPGASCEHLVGLVCHLRSLLSDSCEWLEPGTLEFTEAHPVNAGGVADVWVGEMDNRKVAIKAYRCYSSSNNLVTYMRFYNEALACNRLKDRNIVPFIGVYSTPEHPLALVFEFMDHSNIGEYLRNNGDVGRRELLFGIARGVEHMHKLHIVHGNLKITNILIDAHGHARVAGLGVSFLSSPVPGVDVDRFFHGTAPELVDPQRFGLTDTRTTKESDVYAFGVMAWEIFGGRAPFFDEGVIGGVYSMLSGRRPPRPGHCELSDRVWGMIRGCWKSIPSRRRTIAEVITVLVEELNHE